MRPDCVGPTVHEFDRKGQASLKQVKPGYQKMNGKRVDMNFSNPEYPPGSWKGTGAKRLLVGQGAIRTTRLSGRVPDVADVMMGNSRLKKGEKRENRRFGHNHYWFSGFHVPKSLEVKPSGRKDC